MQFLSEEYQFSSNEKWTLGLLTSGLIYLVSISYFPLSVFPLPFCPWYKIFHLQCPGCGMTRAFISMLKMNIKSAYVFNPLILFVAPYFFYRFLSIIFGVITGKKLFSKWPDSVIWFLQWIFISTYLFLGIIRVFEWLL